MRRVATDIPDVCILEPAIHRDARGHFFEMWNEKTCRALGIDASFKQDNCSRSSAGVLRGLHYQLARPQGKLIHVPRGRSFSVAVDLRRSSPYFGKCACVTLSAENFASLWIPPGFAHGFLALEETDYVYKCTDFYDASDERTLLWNDPDLNIAWPISAPLLSEKDKAGVRLAQIATYP